MATVDTEAAAAGGWVRRSWDKIATVIAVIGLIDLSSQVIKWAKLVHEIAEMYAAVRTSLFGWLPRHITPEWQDAIVLFLIFFSLTNVGLYRRIKHTIASRILRNWGLVNSLSVTTIVIIAFAIFLPQSSATELFDKVIILMTIIFIFIAFLLMFIALSFMAAVLAWRWVLTTAAIFAALVAVNYAYVQWLEPLAER